jgi:hypothetical protein
VAYPHRHDGSLIIVEFSNTLSVDDYEKGTYQEKSIESKPDESKPGLRPENFDEF